jgi:hypothetical protein
LRLIELAALRPVTLTSSTPVGVDPVARLMLPESATVGLLPLSVARSFTLPVVPVAPGVKETVMNCCSFVDSVADVVLGVQLMLALFQVHVGVRVYVPDVAPRWWREKTALLAWLFVSPASTPLSGLTMTVVLASGTVTSNQPESGSNAPPAMVR